MPSSPCVCRDMLGEFKEYMQKERIQLPLELTVQVGAWPTAWCSTAAVALHKPPRLPLTQLLDHVCSHRCTCSVQRAHHHPVLTDPHKRVPLVFLEKYYPVLVTFIKIHRGYSVVLVSQSLLMSPASCGIVVCSATHEA